MQSLFQAIGALVAVILVSGAVSLGIFKLEGNTLPDNPPVEVPDEQVTVASPREVVVGELVKLIADGKLVKWKCFPFNPDCEVYGESGEKFAISFRKPGQYRIVFAIYNRGNLEIKDIEITVVDKQPTVVIDDDPVVPQPLTQNVLLWCQEFGIDKGICKSLSENFAAVAKEIKIGQLTTADEVITRTAELNSSLDLSTAEGVLAKIQTYLINASDEGSLDSMESHATVWMAISEGFQVYASRT